MVTPCLQGNLVVAVDTHVAAHNGFPGKSVFVPVAMTMMMIILNTIRCNMLHCVLMLCEMTLFSLYSKYLRRNFLSKKSVVSFLFLPQFGSDFK